MSDLCKCGEPATSEVVRGLGNRMSLCDKCMNAYVTSLDERDSRLPKQE